MFAKLKPGVHRIKRFLIRPFRGRSRNRDPVQSTLLAPMDWDGLRALTTSLDQTTGIPRLLVTTVAKLSECIKTFDDEARVHSEYGSLRTDLDDLFRELSGYLVGAVSSNAGRSRVDDLARCLNTMVRPMGVKRGEGETGRDDETKDGIDKILRRYGRIRVVIVRFVLSEQAKWGESNEADYDDTFSRLPQSTTARYNSSDPDSTRRNGCTPNTCASVLQQLWIWASYNPHQRLYWLNGPPGAGKTTIAYSFCEELKSVGKLAASFFCARWSPECRDANAILPSISYQLALFSRPFQCVVSNTINRSISSQTMTIRDQFESLIATPLRMVGHTFPSGVVVVVDALDECEDAGLVDQILGALQTDTASLPVKFLVTSRLESNITYRMRIEQDDDPLSELRLSALDPSMVQQDIKTFLEAELSPTGPSTDDLEHLASLSATSFYQAAVLVRYIMLGYQFGNPERTRRLQQLLGSSAASNDTNDEGMDYVYNAILEAMLESDSFGRPEPAETERLLHTVVCARELLTVEALAGLLNTSVARLEHYLLQASRLLLQTSEVGRLVTTRHKSFLGYLVDRRRSGKYCCDVESTNIWLAQACFNSIKALASKPQPGVSASQANRILNVASPHCLYACQYWTVHARLVEKLEPIQAALKLRQVLESSVTSDIDVFYTTLLKRALSNTPAEDTTNRIRELFGTVICAREGLTLSDVEDWTGSDAADLMDSLTPLLLYSGDGTITVLHASFFSYLFDADRSRTFYCDRGQYHTRFTQACFDLIKLPHPPFNICSLPSSYLLDKEVPGIQEAVSMSIPSKLLYACKYWGHHTRLAGYSTTLLAVARDIVATRLLLCMEVLTLSSASEGGVKMLYELHTYLQTVECEDNTRHLVHDAWQFMKQFSDSPVSDSTPHIYVSMLALWPKDRPVSRYYLPRMTGQVQVRGRLGYSPNGGGLVSSSDDQPEPGHSSMVHSVTYSPDGAYIASGSHDRTVRIWDARGGQPVGQPLKGHEGGVLSLAYSPDGSRIASGSYDNTIRIWDARTGQAIGQPLVGHTCWVYSVAYSPDGAYIASGAGDNTVRIWDAHSGQSIGQPLEGHKFAVLSVAYSPDGAHIASGSDDMTVRIWDTKTGQTVGQPLEGHTDWVYSVAYSPDGAHIVSGSLERTIRIWDAKTGKSVGQPLTGHTDQVWTVAYSLNGEYIASGSWDKTIRIWDASTGQPVGRPLKGHTGGVQSVSFSPDGRRLVSGSFDRTIRVWDVSGMLHSGLLAEEESAVTQLVSGPLDSGFGNTQGMQHEIRRPYELDLRGAKLGENWQECFDSDKQDEDFGT
ncbi:hypothetical protein FRC09_003539 [Ceratobasidium sp. 395]|nr:hypothetical protein FRC09_003539 [Ceratobasidium sp. 395]